LLAVRHLQTDKTAWRNNFNEHFIAPPNCWRGGVKTLRMTTDKTQMTDKVKPVLAILGLGLIGGSLAVSVKARGEKWKIRAADRRKSALDFALRRGLIDEVADDFAAACHGADLIVLATPVRSIRSLLSTLASTLKPGQVVTDVGSTKASIVKAAAETLPPDVAFVGAHPVAGTERSGVENVVEGLFEGKTCVITPSDATPPEALETVSKFWKGLGSEIILLDPKSHDRIFAFVSHLPHMAAYCIVNTIVSDLPSRETALSGGGLRDFTRIAESPAIMWRDICLENADEIVKAIDSYMNRLAELRKAVKSADSAAMETIFRRASEAKRGKWIP